MSRHYAGCDSRRGTTRLRHAAVSYDDGVVKMVLALEADRFDVPVSLTRGTLELSRVEGELCAELRGVYSLCRISPNRAS